MQAHISQEKLIADLGQVVTDAEQLLRATAAEAGAKVERLRGRVRDAGREIDERVHENAWTALGVAAGAALLIGLLWSRR